jgi:hypothetical protein
VMAIFLQAGASVASAPDPIPRQSGFSGFIQRGGGYLNIEGGRNERA